MRRECEGCNLRRQYVSVNEEGIEECGFVVTGREDMCPCLLCLIKVMCTSTCDERFEVLGEVTRGHIKDGMNLPKTLDGKEKRIQWRMFG
jgi:hypothetical protein